MRNLYLNILEKHPAKIIVSWTSKLSKPVFEKLSKSQIEDFMKSFLDSSLGLIGDNDSKKK